MDLWIGLGVLLALATGYAAFLRWHRIRSRQIGDDVAARVASKMGGPQIPTGRSKVQTVLIALALLAVIEAGAFVTGTDDELHDFLSSCRTSKSM